MFTEHYGFEAPLETVHVLCGVEATFLETALTAAEELTGSLDSYLSEVAGISSALRSALCEHLLVPGS